MLPPRILRYLQDKNQGREKASILGFALSDVSDKWSPRAI